MSDDVPRETPEPSMTCAVCGGTLKYPRLRVDWHEDSDYPPAGRMCTDYFHVAATNTEHKGYADGE